MLFHQSVRSWVNANDNRRFTGAKTSSGGTSNGKVLNKRDLYSVLPG
jgi:hypothetical protein